MRVWGTHTSDQPSQRGWGTHNANRILTSPRDTLAYRGWGTWGTHNTHNIKAILASHDQRLLNPT